MKIRSDFFKNVSYSLVSNLVYGACLWGVLIIFAKTCSVSDTGKYSLALSITSPVFLFATLNLRILQSTDVEYVYKMHYLMGLRIMSQIIAMAFIAVLSIIIGYDFIMSLAIFLVVVSKSADSISDIIYANWQRTQSMRFVSVSRSVQGIGQVISLTVTLHFTHNLICGLIAIAITSVATTALYDLRLGYILGSNQKEDNNGSIEKLLLPEFNWQRMAEITKTAFPLGIVTVLAMLNATIPRYFIGHFVNVGEIGLFSAMWSVLQLFGIFSFSALQAIMPRISRMYVEDMRMYKRSLNYMLTSCLFVGVFAVTLSSFFGKEILTILFRPEYAKYPVVFIWMMLSTGFYCAASVLESFMYAAKVYNSQAVLWFIIVTVNLVSCFYMVPKYHIQGAVWAYLIGCLVWCLGNSVLMWRLLRQKSTVTLSPAILRQ